jgi:hypothetical protein
MNKIPKYEVVIAPVTNVMLAGQLVEITTYKPDKDYSLVTGVAVSIINPNNDATANFVLIGINDSTKGVQHDDSPFEGWAASSAVEPNKKFLDLNIPCDGRTVKPRVTLTSNAAQNYNVYFTFRLEDEDVEVARVN